VSVTRKIGDPLYTTFQKIFTIIRIFLKSEAPKALYSSHSFIVSALIKTHCCRGIWGELPQACAPGTKGRRDDVILTGLDEESDSTNEEMPPLEPLEPLEGAAQLGEVWLCGHEKTDVIPSPRLSWRCSSGRRSWGMRSSAERRRAERSSAGRTSTWG